VLTKALRNQLRFKLEAKDVLPNINRMQKSRKIPFLSLVTLTFDLQTHPSKGPCEFGPNPFSSSRDISHTKKKPQTDGAKNRTYCSSLHAVKTNATKNFNAGAITASPKRQLLAQKQILQIVGPVHPFLHS